MDAGNDNLILIDELNACQRTITPQIRALSPHSSQITVRAGLKALGAKHHAVEYIDAGTKTRPFYGHRDYLDKVCGAMGLGKFAGTHGVRRRICCWHLGCILPRVPATIVRTG